jgi:hypothetical protein
VRVTREGGALLTDPRNDRTLRRGRSCFEGSRQIFPSYCMDCGGGAGVGIRVRIDQMSRTISILLLSLVKATNRSRPREARAHYLRVGEYLVRDVTVERKILPRRRPSHHGGQHLQMRRFKDPPRPDNLDR